MRTKIIRVPALNPKYKMSLSFQMNCIVRFFNVLSQSYNAAVFYCDSISFLEHVLNQLFLLNESPISQASYLTMVSTICFQLFKIQPILWSSRVVEKNEMNGDVPVSDRRHAFRAA